MKHVVPQSLITLSILLTLCCPASASKSQSTIDASTATDAKIDIETAVEQLLASDQRDKEIEAARLILESPIGNDANAGSQYSSAIKQLGQSLLMSSESAENVLDYLKDDGSTQAAMLQTELIRHIACGDQTPSWNRKAGDPRPDPLPTDKLCECAAALLDHDDPFVRGMAEWAIAIRLGLECEDRRAKPWPSPDESPWYRLWLEVDGESLLDCDYVRQIVLLDQYRDSQGLLDSADALLQRGQAFAGAIQHESVPSRQAALRNSMDYLTRKHQQLVDFTQSHPGDLTGQRCLWLQLRHALRDVVMTNPQLDIDRLLFATRKGPDNGNITNGGVRDIFGPGGDIYVKYGLSPSDPADPLIRDRLGAGHIRGLDLWWDADRVVFSYLKQPSYDSTRDAVSENSEQGRSETAHLYEMQIDGSELKQLTDAPYNSDVEPCYLPGGDIIFVSDRTNYGSQCAGSLHQDKMILNLHRCSGDGSQIHSLSNNKDFDRYPHMLESGQILFTHWEYQERHLWQTHTLWSCRPDGSMTDALYKQHIDDGPMSLREARQIPGESKVVAIACGHHNGEVGAVFIADYRLGINAPDGMRTLTPKVSKTEGGYGNTRSVNEGGVIDGGGHYQFPYPLSDKCFLAAYSYKETEESGARNFGLYYIDAWGNKELIHRDRHSSVNYLMPLRPRPRPFVLEESPLLVHEDATSSERSATLFMSDVQSQLPDIEPGTIKYLRICQHVPWPCVREEDKACGFNDLHSTASGAWTRVFGAWTWAPARVIGIVPVAEDGSAHFNVPADQPIYFQALDENYLEVRRMRSNVTLKNNEFRGCIGCHESRNINPPSIERPVGLALMREPSWPEPPAWGCSDLPSYERDIQPILDRHCVRCHGETDPDGGIELTSHRIGDYVQSYRSLFGVNRDETLPVSNADAWRWLHPNEPSPPEDKAWYQKIERNEIPEQLVSLADRFGDAEVTQPHAFGSGKSRLTRILVDDPLHRKEVDMPREDWIALATWVDLNAPYFDTFANKDTAKDGNPAELVRVRFPDPWITPPAGQWIWKDDRTVVLEH